MGNVPRSHKSMPYALRESIRKREIGHLIQSSTIEICFWFFPICVYVIACLSRLLSVIPCETKMNPAEAVSWARGWNMGKQRKITEEDCKYTQGTRTWVLENTYITPIVIQSRVLARKTFGWHKPVMDSQTPYLAAWEPWPVVEDQSTVPARTGRPHAL